MKIHAPKVLKKLSRLLTLGAVTISFVATSSWAASLDQEQCNALALTARSLQALKKEQFNFKNPIVENALQTLTQAYSTLEIFQPKDPIEQTDFSGTRSEILQLAICFTGKSKASLSAAQINQLAERANQSMQILEETRNRKMAEDANRAGTAITAVGAGLVVLSLDSLLVSGGSSIVLGKVGLGVTASGLTVVGTAALGDAEARKKFHLNEAEEENHQFSAKDLAVQTIRIYRKIRLSQK
jgi:hypothetical protein